MKMINETSLKAMKMTTHQWKRGMKLQVFHHHGAFTKIILLIMFWEISQYEYIYTRSKVHNLCQLYAFIYQIGPKTAGDALIVKHWLMTMHKKLNQFERN